MAASPGRVTLVLSMATTIHLIFKSKHAGTHTLRLLAQQLPPPQLEACVCVSACVCARAVEEICVVNSKSLWGQHVCVSCSALGVVSGNASLRAQGQTRRNVQCIFMLLTQTCKSWISFLTKGGSYSSGDGARNKAPVVQTVFVCVWVHMLSLTVSPTDRHFLFTPLSATGCSASHPIKQNVFFQESTSTSTRTHRQRTVRKLRIV